MVKTRLGVRLTDLELVEGISKLVFLRCEAAAGRGYRPRETRSRSRLSQCTCKWQDQLGAVFPLPRDPLECPQDLRLEP